MNPIPYQPAGPRPRWAPVVPPNQPMSISFWETANVRDQFKNLHDTLKLQMLQLIKDGKGYDDGEASVGGFSEFLKERRLNVESRVSLSVEAANALMAKLRVELEPFRMITYEMCPWEEKSAAVRLANKIHKSYRNKRWRKTKRKHIAEMIAKVRERFEEADREADEWRARDIAKDIAKRKMEDMKKIAKLNVKEERKRLESEVIIMFDLNFLGHISAVKFWYCASSSMSAINDATFFDVFILILCHFLPEEDAKFLERVRAAVEEEEQQVNLAADIDAAKDAIATVEQSRKTTENNKESKDQTSASTNSGPSTALTNKESGKQVSEEEGHNVFIRRNWCVAKGSRRSEVKDFWTPYDLASNSAKVFY
ncbi:U11/U12 small nuclear ribonucleoprotein 59 kDa protein [Pyrus ussuriensis x Pyrus communis]|uniref:U11/U12 small nuclear ribonucleoprotein 59 kDa protein n=1 Tax=Pyrus ussuriensis x Pyrus communis TaxID=2448454 RepID=A0A5N5F6U7_9ROSA|nr:U11/U12 small nuclear ribonucleoprotein 59 kDa protein [Pyrus ussuriensis x Pyrus communis]